MLITALLLIMSSGRAQFWGPSDSQKIEALIQRDSSLVRVSVEYGSAGLLPEVTVNIKGHIWRKNIFRFQVFFWKGRWAPEGDPKAAEEALDAFYAKEMVDSS